MKGRRFAGLALFAMILAFVGTSQAKNADGGKAPKAFFPESIHQFETVVDGSEVTHGFTVQNKGDAPLEVQNVATG